MPLDSIVNPIYEIANGGFVGMGAAEVFPSVKRAGEEERGVDGRQLTFPSAQAGVHIEEMEKPTSVTDMAHGIGTLGLFVERPKRP